MTRPIVIGYGNTLRGDDGAGPAVAALVGVRVPGADCLAVPMLMPELAPVLAGASVVVFVDASVEGEPGCVRTAAIDPDGDLGAFGHLLSAGALMALARQLYGCSAPAFQVSIDARCFDVGTPLSPDVRAALPAAAAAVAAVLSQSGSPA